MAITIYPQQKNFPHAPDDVFSQVDMYVEDSKTNVSKWEDKMDKYHRIRMGIKKVKNFPFKDSSNLRIPTAEKNIRKAKASIMGAVFGVRPVVQVLPTPRGDFETANKIEKLMDHLVMDVMKLNVKGEIGVDKALEKGFYLAKPYWRLEIVDRDEELSLRDFTQEQLQQIFILPDEQIAQLLTEKFDVDLSESVAEENIATIEKVIATARDKFENNAKRKKITFSLKDVVHDFPDVDFIKPERCYVPTDTGWDVQKASSVTLEFFLPLEVVEANVKNKGWDSEAVEMAKEYGRNADRYEKQVEFRADFREGITRMCSPSRMVRVWESYGWYDIGNGKRQKSFVTCLPDFGKCVRKVLVDTHSGEYPVVKMFYDFTDDRWFNHRGIPELLEDLIKEIDVQHNMKIDIQTMTNFPMIVYRAGHINPNLVRANPAQAIPVKGIQPLGDTIAALNFHNPNAEFSYEREQMVLEGQIQEVVGQIDFSLQSMINKRQPRTLGEVQQQQASAGQVFSLDLSHFTNSFSEIFQKIYELWVQYGPDEYEFNYFGDKLRQGETLKVSREELQGKYIIKVRGNDQNTNPAVKMQKAQQVLAAVTNPLLIQTGVVDPVKIANGMKRFFEAMDIENYEEIINVTPQPQPQPDPTEKINLQYQDLEPGEKAQVLQRRGIQADIGSHTEKRNLNIVEKSMDIAERITERDDE